MLPSQEDLTRTEKTKDWYLQRLRFLSRASEAKEDQFTSDGLAPVDQLISALEYLHFWRIYSHSTRRTYVASIKWLISKSQDENDTIVCSEQNLSVLRELNNKQPNDRSALRKRRPKRGPSQKAKYASPEKLQELHEALMHAGENGSFAALWLTVSIHVGLRPCEWEDAMLIGNELVVTNAKNTNARSHSDDRTLILDDWHIAQDITVFLARMRELMSQISRRDPEGNAFKTIYDTVRKIIHRSTRNLWPESKTFPSLYTGRHLFAANAKANGASKEEIAAMMGHGSIHTAGRHYLQGQFGGSNLRVRPRAEDVNAVIARRTEQTNSVVASRMPRP